MYRLKREKKKLQEIADISIAQAAALGAVGRKHDSELKSLRERVRGRGVYHAAYPRAQYCVLPLLAQLRHFASKGDDAAIIGKLQHQLMTMTAAYQAFVKKHDMMRTALNRVELFGRAHEMVADQTAAELTACRQQFRLREVALTRNCDSVCTCLVFKHRCG